MWADTLLAAEEAHVFSVLLWAALSALAGTALLALAAVRRAPAPLIRGLGLLCLACAAAELAAGVLSRRALAMRDYDGALRLLATVELNVGIAVAILLAGMALAIVAWAVWRGRRLGLVGAGLAFVVHGAALLVLNGRFLTYLSSAIRT